MDIEIILFWVLTSVYVGFILFELRMQYVEDTKDRNSIDKPGFISWLLSRQCYFSGLRAIERKRYKKAILQFKRSLHFDPDYGQGYLELGKAFLNTGKIQSAQAMLEKSIVLIPQNHKTYLTLGLILFEQGKIQNAIQYFDEAYALDKSDIDILLARGAGFFDLRKIELAMECYSKAIELASTNQSFTTVVEHVLKFFDCLLQKGIGNYFEKLSIKYDDITSSDNFERIFDGIYSIDKEIKFSSIEKAAILMLCFPAKDCAALMQRFSSVYIKKLAEIMSTLSDVRLVDKKNIFKEFLEITDWEQIIKLESDEAKRYCNLGKSFIERNNMELAINQFKKALRIDPSYLDARKELGMAFARSGQINDAIIEWERIISLGYKDAELHKQLGDAYARLGKLSQASREWRKAAAMDRSNGEVR